MACGIASLLCVCISGPAAAQALSPANGTVAEIHIIGHTRNMPDPQPDRLIERIRQSSLGGDALVLLLAGGNEVSGDTLDERLEELGGNLERYQQSEEGNAFYLNNSTPEINRWLAGLDASRIRRVDIRLWSHEVYFDGFASDLRVAVPDLACWREKDGFSGIDVPDDLTVRLIFQDDFRPETAIFLQSFFGAGKAAAGRPASVPGADAEDPVSGCWLDASKVEDLVAQTLRQHGMTGADCQNATFDISADSTPASDFLTCASPPGSPDLSSGLAAATPAPVPAPVPVTPPAPAPVTAPTPAPVPATPAPEPVTPPAPEPVATPTPSPVPAPPAPEPVTPPTPAPQAQPATPLPEPAPPEPTLQEPVDFSSVAWAVGSVTVMRRTDAVAPDRLTVAVPTVLDGAVRLALLPSGSSNIPALDGVAAALVMTPDGATHSLAGEPDAGLYDLWAYVDVAAACPAAFGQPLLFSAQVPGDAKGLQAETTLLQDPCDGDARQFSMRVMRLEVSR